MGQPIYVDRYVLEVGIKGQEEEMRDPRHAHFIGFSPLSVGQRRALEEEKRGVLFPKWRVAGAEIEMLKKGEREGERGEGREGETSVMSEANRREGETDDDFKERLRAEYTEAMKRYGWKLLDHEDSPFVQVSRDDKTPLLNFKPGFSLNNFAKHGIKDFGAFFDRLCDAVRREDWWVLGLSSASIRTSPRSIRIRLIRVSSAIMIGAFIT